jgi:gluconolactonase
VSDFIEVIDPRFKALTRADAQLEVLHEGGLWLEGPLWLADTRQLLFSDIPNDRVLRWVPGLGSGVFSEGGLDFQNGRTRDSRGRVVACQHGHRRLVAYEPSGAVTVLASHHAGGRLNSPNDVVAQANGTLWFTDPDYGILSDYEGRKAPSEQAACHVYRLAPGASEPQAVVRTMVKPNGLVVTDDGRWLYVAESGLSHIPGTPPEIRRFAINPGGSVEDTGVFASLDCGFADGMALDEHGNLWSSAGDGVHCFAPDGTLLGKLQLGCVSSNLCFGGPDRSRIFITTAKRLFAVEVAVRGAPEAF